MLIIFIIHAKRNTHESSKTHTRLCNILRFLALAKNSYYTIIFGFLKIEQVNYYDFRTK